MREVTEIVHWPGKDVPACAEHAAKLRAVGQAMGFAVADKVRKQEERRGLVRLVFWSAVIVGLCCGLVWWILQ
jgi:hypothetical protein